MPQSLEERVAYLEGKVEEQSRCFGELTVHISALDQKVDRFRIELAARIDGLSARVDALDQKIDRFRAELAARIDGLSARMDALDQKVDRFRAELAARVDALDQKMSMQFVWLVGIQIAVLLAVIGALLR
jgi:uncharacterized coiled-coil protein SlyX